MGYKLKNSTCVICKKEKSYKNTKYCSRKCYGISKRGTKHSFVTKEKMRRTRNRLIKDGKINTWNKGLPKELQPLYNKKHSEETRKKIGEKMSLLLKGKLKSRKHKINLSKSKMGLWKGKTYEEIYGKKKAKRIIKKKSGKNHWNWLGGISISPYIKFNDKFKRKIRKRDNYICMLCGIHQEKLKRVLDIHHINYNKKISTPKNCISLCKKCHIGKTNKNRKLWTKFFKSLLTKKYGYKYN